MNESQMANTVQQLKGVSISRYKLEDTPFPSKYEMFPRCWFNVSTPSLTMANIKPTLGERLVSAGLL